jgi:hypothetical protein
MSIYSRYEAQTEADWQASEEANAMGEIVSACAKAIFDAFDAETMEQLQRNIYKYTDCGPSVSFELFSYEDADDALEAYLGDSVVRPSKFIYVGDNRAATITSPWLSIRKIGVSSIVENSDAEVPVQWLDLEEFANDEKFEGDVSELAAAAVEAFGKIVEEVNDEACALWSEAND